MELISREEVKTIIECVTGYHQSIKDAFDRVMELPIIESRPKGVWVENKTNIGMGYSCPICGALKVHKHNYCEECGADMRGEIDCDTTDCRLCNFHYCGLHDYNKAVEKYSKSKGEWQANTEGTDYRVCSICNYTRHAGIKYNYCPNCGADMRGEK